MIDATLAFFRGDATAGAPELTDLGAMQSTLCNATADAGYAVSYDGSAHLDRSCRPVSLRRAVSNPIDNAIRYGGGARVRLRVEQSGALTLTNRPERGLRATLRLP